MYGGPMGPQGNMQYGQMGGPGSMGSGGHGNMGPMGGPGMNPAQMRSNEMAYNKFNKDAVNFQMENNRPNNFTSIGNVDTYGANNPNSMPRNMVNPNVATSIQQPTGT